MKKKIVIKFLILGSKKKKKQLEPNSTISSPILGQTQHKIRKPKGKFPKLHTTGKIDIYIYIYIYISLTPFSDSKGLMW